MSDFEFDEFSSDSPSNDEKIAITDASFYEKMKNTSKELAEIFVVNEDVAFQCLQAVAWDVDKFMNEMAEDRKKFLGEASIHENESNLPRTLHSFDGDTVPQCGVCFNDVEKSKLFALPCNHFFCEDCWKDQITHTVNEGASTIRCMEPKCLCTIMPSDVKKMCGEELFKKFEEKLAAITVSVSKSVRRCINPQCNLSLGIESVGLCNVATCKCGTRICWKCGAEAHAPLSCENISKWNDTAKVGSTKQWAMSNTKPCGKCGARIEKIGGCNHMKCSNCGFEFCWICGHEWSTHEGEKYTCNQYKDFDKISFESNEENARMTHYCSHFDDHYTSMQIEKQKINEFRNMIEKILKKQSRRFQISADELEEKIKYIVSVRDCARSVLMWSYPYAYMITPGSSELKLFEFVQKELEMALEKLLFYIQCTLANPSYPKLMNMASLVDKCTESLLKHVDISSK